MLLSPGTPQGLGILFVDFGLAPNDRGARWLRGGPLRAWRCDLVQPLLLDTRSLRGIRGRGAPR